MNFKEYEDEAVKTAIYPGRGTPLGLMYVGLKMNGEAGEFAEHIGKSIRDDGFGTEQTSYIRDYDGTDLGTEMYISSNMTKTRRELLIKEIGDVLWYLAAGAAELGTDLETIAKQNIEKLRDRKERGKLGGSGDNR